MFWYHILLYWTLCIPSPILILMVLDLKLFTDQKKKKGVGEYNGYLPKEMGDLDFIAYTKASKVWKII